jgi:hypothetical protein
MRIGPGRGARPLDDDGSEATPPAASTARATSSTHVPAIREPHEPGPVLGKATAHLEQAGPVALRFDATAPGADFAAKGREATAVSIYVDGRYHSSEAIFSERGSYRINLGSLPPGDHAIEIRDAHALGGGKAHPAAIREASIALEPSTGLRAEIDRHAPILVARGPKKLLGLITTDGRSTLTQTDVPLRMRADVLGDPAGVHVISYRVMFSDEDSGTPDAERVTKYKRTTDDEWLTKVVVDGSGNRVSAEDFARLKKTPLGKKLGLDKLPSSETYQYGDDTKIPWGKSGHRHVPTAFDGTHLGDRPVLQVNSGNNNFASVKDVAHVDAPAWSTGVDFDEAARKTGPGGVPVISKKSDLDVMKEFPYLATLSAKEIRRES